MRVLVSFVRVHLQNVIIKLSIRYLWYILETKLICLCIKNETNETFMTTIHIYT